MRGPVSLVTKVTRTMASGEPPDPAASAPAEGAPPHGRLPGAVLPDRGLDESTHVHTVKRKLQ